MCAWPCNRSRELCGYKVSLFHDLSLTICVWEGRGAMVRDWDLPKSSQTISHRSIQNGVIIGVPSEDHMIIQLLTAEMEPNFIQTVV